MTFWFVDANVFLRFFTGDDPGQRDRAERLFKEAAAGRRRLITGPPVFFEVAWTLRTAYRLSKPRVLQVLESITALPGLILSDAGLVHEALRLASARGVEFADAYILASAEAGHCDGVATFNAGDFRKMDARLLEF